MTAEILRFNGITTLPIDPDQVLEQAAGKLERVLVLGFDKETSEFYAASSHPDGGTTLWLLEACKLALFKAVE